MARRELEPELARAVREAFTAFGTEVTLHGDVARDAKGRDYGLGGLLEELEQRPGAPLDELARAHVLELVVAMQGPTGVDIDTPEETAARLHPLLLEAASLSDAIRRPHVPEFVPGVLEFLAVNSPVGWQALTAPAVAELGDRDTLRAAARERLGRLPVENHEVRRARHGGSYHVVTGRSPLTGTRVVALEALHRTLTGAELPPDGALVAFPSAFLLIFAPFDGEAAAVLQDLVETAAQQHHASPAPLSPHTYWWRDGRLTPLTAVGAGGLLDVRLGDDFVAAATRLARGEADLPEPRRHHYRFAHRLLPSLTHLDAVPHAQLDTELLRLWEEYGSHQPVGQRLEPDGLRAGFVQAGPHRMVLVALPMPRAATEAFAVALAWPGDGSAQRAFTLEYAVDPVTGERGAVLGEWADGSHHLRQTGLSAEARPFVNAVARLLDAPAPKPRRLGFFRRG